MSCVLTLALDPESEQRFQQLRWQHFPPELDRVPAHLSLFHVLPESAETVTVLEQAAAVRAVFPVSFSGVRSIGRGVAYFAESQQLESLHTELSRHFAAVLTPQDCQGFRPHVVVQNKTTSQHARETLALLQAGFSPFQAMATGLTLWRYLGGPWELLRSFAFRPA